MLDKILIVDDDDLVLACCERLLVRQFNVETAIGPLEALEAIAVRGPYAVILSDLRMPGMNGVQFLEKARTLSPNTVGVVLSGNIQQSDLDACAGAVFRVLDKPCPTALLAGTLKDAIAHHHKLCSAN